MARPRTVSDADILTATRDALFEHGPSTSTSVIAKRVGLSQAALFKRFGNKMNLLVRALGIPDGPPWAERALAGPTDAPIDDQLRELSTIILGFFDKMLPRMMMLKSCGVDPKSLFEAYEEPPPVRGMRALTHWFHVSIDQGRLRDLNPEACAISLVGQLQSRAFWRHMIGRQLMDEDDVAYVNHVVDIFWRGARPQEDAP